MNARLRKIYLIAAAVLAIASGHEDSSAQTEAEAANIVADQVREQGFACAEPVRASRDAQGSEPNEALWLLQCADARYRVRLIPDQGAEISPVD